MEFEIEFGEHKEFFKLKKEAGLATPLDDLGALDQYQLDLLSAFYRLTAIHGSKIPVSEMESYMRVFGISDAHLFFDSMQTLINKKITLGASTHGDKN